MTKSILLVHIPGVPARTLAEQLTGQGFPVRSVPPGDMLLPETQASLADLVLLDAPSLGGRPAEACLALRDAGVAGPIVVLGASPAEEGAARAAGADDCLAKPFRLAGLLTVLRDQLRDPAVDQSLTFGDYQLFPLTRHLVDGAGRQIRLTEKETAILVYLYRAGARVVPREELLGEVWGYSGGVSTHTVETHIYRLRRKIDGEDGRAPLLSTEAGGYRLEAGIPPAA